MALQVGELAAILDLDDGPFDRKLSGVGGRLSGLAGLAGKAALGIGAALAGGAIAGTMAFAGFEKGMNEVFTLLPGITDRAMGDMTGDVKDFAREFGVLPDKVVPALYQSLSAGVPPDNVFAFLETAQKAAKGGVTELETAVDGISSVVNAYGSDVLDATAASDLMFTAVRLGKTNFEELSASLFNVTPTAAALGVKFEDITAALASMTAQGVPTSVATTQLRQLFVELSKEGTKASTAFKAMGDQTFKEFIASGGDLEGALERLQMAVGEGFAPTLADLFGSVEAGSAALALTGKNAEGFGKNLEAMGASAGATEAAYEQMDQGVSASFDRIKAAGMVFLIEVGERLAPVVGAVADVIGDRIPQAFDILDRVFTQVSDAVSGVVERFGFVQGIIDAVSSFIQGNSTPVIAGLAAAIGGPLVAALVAWTVAQIAALAPIIAVGAAIALLVGGVVYAYQNFETFRDVIDTVARFLVETVWPTVQQFADFIVGKFQELQGWVNEIWPDIQEAITHVMNVVSGVISTVTDVITRLWGTFGDNLLRLVGVVWNQIRNLIETAIGIIQNVIELVLAVINGDWGKAWDAIKDILNVAWEFIRETVVNALDYVWQVLGIALDAIGLLWEVAWDRMVSTISGAIGGIIGFFAELPGRILGALGDLARFLVGKGVDLVSGMISGLVEKAADLWSWVTGLPGEIAGRIGDAGRWLYNAGKDVIGGFISGLRGMAGGIVRAIRETIVDKIPGFVKSALGISSPSRLFAELGKAIPAGLAQGIRVGSLDVDRAMRDLTGAASTEMFNLQMRDLALTAHSSVAGGVVRHQLDGAGILFDGLERKLDEVTAALRDARPNINVTATADTPTPRAMAQATALAIQVAV